ncbi:MBOAT, membrane-bound O-acyltransferase family-domain-containing protein [Lipomyces arxii]|uniref:MBOAT, membrane-bound O-acyltransferase family-domain-containing protein n=1 Tax=Lipomyces arxii TaxID=56418 RepID=UPI0034CF9CE1
MSSRRTPKTGYKSQRGSLVRKATDSMLEAEESENLRKYRELKPTYAGKQLGNDEFGDSTVSLASSGTSTPDMSANTTGSSFTTVSDLSTNKEVITQVTTTTKTESKTYERKSRRPRYKDVKFQPHTTIFEAEASRSSVFTGFYTLFWLGTFVLFVKTVSENYKRTGYILDTHVLHTLFRDLYKIAFTDLALFLSTFMNVFLQKAVAARQVSWPKFAWLVQSFYELFFIIFAIWFPIHLDYPWIGRVFLCLHSLVLLMKQHSYSFFCGYMSVVRNDLAMFESALAGLKNEEGPKTPSVSQRDQEDKLQQEIAICKTELSSALPGSNIMYPQNVTLFNFFDYMMLPTLVYEVEYPRTKSIRWSYVFEKLVAIFGVFFLMIIIAEQYFYPVVMLAVSLRSLNFYDKVLEYPFLLLQLLFPFMLMYLLTWYIIWDAILNEIAELTRFADRYFYGAWWNSVQWDQFARDWNVPVHQFLLRHVYHSSISAFRVSKGAATVITFLLSSIVHELVMFVIFKKLRGYLLVLQMLQLPLVQLSKTSFFKHRRVFGNIVFWLGIYTGPSMMCVLYLTF